MNSKYLSIPAATTANGRVNAGWINPKILIQKPNNIKGPMIKDTKTLVIGEIKEICLK